MMKNGPDGRYGWRRSACAWAAALAFCLPAIVLVCRATDAVYCSVDIVESPDSDGDGLTDANEAWLGSDPGKRDTDKDGLSDGKEYIEIGSDPLNPDTDGDEIPDGWEVDHGLDPLVTNEDIDTDFDGLIDYGEYVADTSPTNDLEVFEVGQCVFTGDGAEIVLHWNTATGRTYVVYGVTNLLLPWTNVYETAGDGVPKSYTNSGQDDVPRFFRLGVSLDDE